MKLVLQQKETLTLAEEERLAGIFAFLASTSNDHRKVAALCLHKANIGRVKNTEKDMKTDENVLGAGPTECKAKPVQTTQDSNQVVAVSMLTQLD